MTKKEYNGWTNYETWNIALWIGNEQGSANYWDEQADQALESNPDDPDSAISDLARELENNFDEQSNEMLDQAGVSSSWMADLMGAALSEVNWYEIASGMIDEAKERIAQ